MNFLSNEYIMQLCPLNNLCQNKLCQGKHPRIYRQICINYIQSKCNNEQNCKKNHIPLNQLRLLMQVPTINGIYQHNLCQKVKCRDQQCQYLHPEWLELVCWECLNFNYCSDITHDWLWLREKVYSKYNQQGINPENLNCTKQSHYLDWKNTCLLYFKGLCPYIECKDAHYEWEDYNIVCTKFELDQVLKPCQSEQIHVQRYSHNVYQNKHQLAYLNTIIRETQIIDVIFILDCTCSMTDWIYVAQNQICGLIEEFKSKIPHSTLRIAAVCYRDFTDQPQHIFYHNFTTKGEIIQQFISKMEAKGGDDLPEDLVGALEKAYTFNISAHLNSILNIFIITDAPCHGLCYHNLMKDNYCQNQAGKLENILIKLQNLKPKLFVFFFQISKHTRKMEQIMQKTLRCFYTIKGDKEEFKDQVKFSLERSVSESSQNAQVQKSSNFFQVKYVKQRYIKQNYNGSQQQYLRHFNSEFEGKQLFSMGDLQIEINELDLPENEKGTTQRIYKAFDSKNNRYVALKIPKINQYTEFEINKAHEDAKIRYKYSFKIIIVYASNLLCTTIALYI